VVGVLDIFRDISLVIGPISMVIAILIGWNTLRKHYTEPIEKMVAKTEEWKSNLEKEFRSDEKWRGYRDDQREVNDKLKRDYDSINELKREVRHIIRFEKVMLKSMDAMLNHMKSGNHIDKIDNTLNSITEFMLKEFRDDDDM
jgi:hypothetical protein